MKTVKTSKELYYEVLKSFYLGVYRKGDRFLTYREAKEKYNLSKQTIGIAYKRLQEDGFIRTEGVNGTIVTFDLSDPDHLSRVPFYRPGPGRRDINTYTVPIGILSNTLYGGLSSSDSQRLKEYRERVNAITGHLRGGTPFHQLEEELILYVVNALDNQYLSMIVDHFFSRYMYFELESRLPLNVKQELRDSAARYYAEASALVDRGELEDIQELTCKYYDAYYMTPGALVFAKMGGEKFDREQTLYSRLLHGLYAKIIEDGLKAGDYLPTIKQLCEENGVSKTTVRKAYSILAEMDLISSKVRDGTKLIAEFDNPKLQTWLEEVASKHKKSMKDALEALGLLQRELFRDKYLPTGEMIFRQMREILEEQRGECQHKGMPYFVSFVMVTPLLAKYPEGVLQKYFFYLTDVVDKLITLYFFRFRGLKEKGENIYSCMSRALDALERGDRPQFEEQAKEAFTQNSKLLLTVFEHAVPPEGIDLGT